MRQFPNIRNWPIQRKLLLIILTTIVVSLVLVMAGIFAYELTTYRTRLAREIAGVAGLIAANSAPTLAFDDPQTAQEILATLTSSGAVAAAGLYTNDGRVFASYVRSNPPSAPPPSNPGAEGPRFAARYLELVHPIQQKGRNLGTLYLRADMANVYERLTGYAGILLVVALAIGGSAFLLQRLLQRLVSEPLLRLSMMAESIAGGDLTAHVPVESADEMGQLAGAFNHMADELGQSYEVLRESENRYRTLFNAIDEGFCIVEMIFDEEDRPIDYLFLETNPSFDKQTGMIDAKGKRMRELAPTLEEYWFETYGKIALTGQPARFENHAEPLGHWYDVYAFRFGEPENRQVAILFNDINERRRAEEELRKAKDELEVRVLERTEELSRALQNVRTQTEERIHAVEELRRKEHMLMQQSRLAALGEMLVNISHQWRQPLNVLGIILQEVHRNYQRGNFTGEYLAASVDRARGVITHMSRTIDDFRNFFRPDKLKTSFDVKEVVETTISMVRDSFNELQVDLRMDAEDNIKIDGFRNEYAQAIMNILVNARDAFRERGIVNPVIAVKIFRENGRSVVTIADNAGGIAGEVLEKVFDPYFTTKDPDKGTGIGLFMSKTIIEKNMNGSLTARNTDEGAEFRIEV